MTAHQKMKIFYKPSETPSGIMEWRRRNTA